MPKTRLSLTETTPPRSLVSDLSALVASRPLAERLLAQTTAKHLANASLSELAALMPIKKAERLSKLLRFARAALTPEPPQKVGEPDAVYRLLYPLILGVEAERFFAIPVSADLRVLAVTCVAQGTPNSVEVRPADVFAPAIRHRASILIVAHNHPSGALAASDCDLLLTDRLLEGAAFLGIDLIDHVIVTTSAAASIRDEFAIRGRRWRRPEPHALAASVSAASALIREPLHPMTDRQHDQLVGHLEMLLDRVKQLRTEGRLPSSERQVRALLSAVEDYDLQADPTVLEAHSFLRGMAAGLGLSDVGELAAYVRDRATRLPNPPNWASLVRAASAAAAGLAAVDDLADARATGRVLQDAIDAWRDAPWR